MKVCSDFNDALRTSAYFMASGAHYMLENVEYLELFGEDPSAIEIDFAIFSYVIEMDDDGQVLNFTYAQKRAADYLKLYCNPAFEVSPPFEAWELELYGPPDLQDKI